MGYKWEDYYGKGAGQTGKGGGHSKPPDTSAETVHESQDAPPQTTSTGVGRGNLFGGMGGPTYSNRAYENLLSRRWDIVSGEKGQDYASLVTWANRYWSQPQFKGWNTKQRRDYATRNFGTRWGTPGDEYRNPPTQNQMAQPGSNQPQLTYMNNLVAAGTGPSAASDARLGINRANIVAAGENWGGFYNHRMPQPWADGMLPATRPPENPTHLPPQQVPTSRWG